MMTAIGEMDSEGESAVNSRSRKMVIIIMIIISEVRTLNP